MSFFKRKSVASTAFSNFIREADSATKKQVYTEVLKRATDRQNAVIKRRCEKKK